MTRNRLADRQEGLGASRDVPGHQPVVDGLVERLPQRGEDVDYHAVVAALVHHGFDGPYTIEWSGTGDPNLPAREDLQYLKRILADVAADNAAERERAMNQKALEGATGPIRAGA